MKKEYDSGVEREREREREREMKISKTKENVSEKKF